MSLLTQFCAGLPYKPTQAQSRVLSEIQVDLAKDEPMHRLVQGDVGAGKTLVAAMAALPVLAAGHQVPSWHPPKS